MLIIFFFIIAIFLVAFFLYISYVVFFEEKSNRSKAIILSRQLEEIKQKNNTNARRLLQKAYQAEVLRGLSERIGYSLDIPKIIEVITGSLGEVLDYNTASYMIFKDEHILFHCFVSKPVNHQFIKDVRTRMMAAFTAMLNTDLSSNFIDETISGTVLDDTLEQSVESFFNLPLVINEQIVGLINVACSIKNLYSESETKILYTITRQAADHYEKLKKLLQEEKRRLNSMVSSMADGVIMLDKEMNLLVFNPAAKQMLGLQGVKEPTILDIANNLSGRVDLRNKLDQALEQNLVVEQKDIFLEDKALHLLISPVKDSKGELLGSAILFRDITAQKELEKMRDEFTAMMVHELRAPLTTIKGTTDMILNEKRVPDETKARLLQTMKDDSENMLSLVGDLLDVAKIEAGKFQIEPTIGDISQTVKEVIAKFEPQAKQKGLIIESNFAENTLQTSFDKLRISQVLNNLLSNAIKYTEKGLIIIVDVNYNNTDIIISIKDTGSGMEADELAGLFSKFKQFGKGKSGQIKGTGLGLVIAKGIVEAHGGQIKAESEGYNKGSIFTFTLPIVKGGEAKING